MMKLKLNPLTICLTVMIGILSLAFGMSAVSVAKAASPMTITPVVPALGKHSAVARQRLLLDYQSNGLFQRQVLRTQNTPLFPFVSRIVELNRIKHCRVGASSLCRVYAGSSSQGQLYQTRRHPKYVNGWQAYYDDGAGHKAHAEVADNGALLTRTYSGKTTSLRFAGKPIEVQLLIRIKDQYCNTNNYTEVSHTADTVLPSVPFSVSASQGGNGSFNKAIAAFKAAHPDNLIGRPCGTNPAPAPTPTPIPAPAAPTCSSVNGVVLTYDGLTPSNEQKFEVKAEPTAFGLTVSSVDWNWGDTTSGPSTATLSTTHTYPNQDRDMILTATVHYTNGMVAVCNGQLHEHYDPGSGN